MNKARSRCLEGREALPCTLDSYEEMVWLAASVQPIPHVYAVVLDAELDWPTLQTAWRRLHDRHPILSATIRKRPGERPVFVDGGKVSPVERRDVSFAHDVARAVAAELDRGIDPEQGLFRLGVLPGLEQHAVLLTAHHAAVDGRSSLVLLRDLLALASDVALDAPAPWMSRSAAFGRPVPTAYRKIAPADDPHAATPADAPLPVRISRLALSEVETTAIVTRARREGVSVHAALMVAAASVVARARRDLDAVRCATPIDIRGVAGLREALGLLLVNRVTSLGTDSLDDFWAAAGKAREDVRHARDLAAVEKDLELIEGAVAAETGRDAMRQRSEASRYELLITNEGATEFHVGEDERVRVADLWSAVCSGAPSTQILSVLTWQGRLGLTLASREPIAGLLDDVAALLRRNS